MALPINIDLLLTGETVEWDRIEFKKGWNPKVIMHTICAFANDINNWGGGYLLLGIEEQDGLPILPPYGIDKKELDGVQKELTNLCYKISPHYFPIAQPYVIDGQHILAIWCPGGDNRPYQAPRDLSKGSPKEYYIRRNSITKIAHKSDLDILKEIAQKIPFDDRINHHAKIDDLDFALIREYLETVKSELRHNIAKTSLKDLSIQMQIVGGVQEDMHPKNVGLLMFSNKPSTSFRGA